MTSGNQPSWDDLREEASLWLARLDSGSSSLEAFEAWRDADPRRAAAFAQVAAALGTVDRVKPDFNRAVSPVKAVNRRHILFGTSAAGIAVAGGGLFAVSQSRASVSTNVGQQRLVTLKDGGSFRLNTDTHVTWRLQAKALQIWLEQGEVAIDLRGTQKVCRLNAAGKHADFSQGAVNARLDGKVLDISVLSGACEVGAIQPAMGALARPPNLVRVSASQAAVLAGGAPVIRDLSPPDRDMVSAWQSGEVVFQGQSLEAAVAEYNRYLAHKILIGDPSLAPIRLGGRFTTHDPEAFLQALHGTFGIRATDDGAGTIILTK